MENLNIDNIVIHNITQRTVGIIGGKGSGKTTTIKIMALAVEKIPCYIFDPLNVIHIEGFDRVVFGKNSVKQGASAGKLFNQKFKKNIIFALCDMLQEEQAEFINAFFSEWKPKNCLIFIDEIQDFTPQNATGAKYCSEIERAVKHWRNRNVGFIFDTQRPAYTNKNVLALIDFLILFRITYPHDVQAVEEILGNMLTEEQTKTVISSIQTKSFLNGYAVDFRSGENGK